MAPSQPTFDVKLMFQGKSATIHGITSTTTVEELKDHGRSEFDLSETTMLKLLCKGKVLGNGVTSSSRSTPNHTTSSTSCSCCRPPKAAAFPNGAKSKSGFKVMIMATSDTLVTSLNSKRSDPTIRGFEEEERKRQQQERINQESKITDWGPQHSAQSKQYKFCRFEACTWQSFGHRPTSTTPHAFQAMQLLQKLATDPGIVAIMKERELVVGTLGEMDPIDDRIMQKKQQQGACLLGYNTNAGARIDVRLRTHDLQHFLPYESIAATLIHELSHNWVSEHNALFWTNYGQMRVEYLHTHVTLAKSGYVIHGKTSAAIAGLPSPMLLSVNTAALHDTVLTELNREMAQHGIPVSLVAPAIRQRCQELVLRQTSTTSGGYRLGGGGGEGTTTTSSVTGDMRNLVLAAAERRARNSSNRSKQIDKDGSRKDNAER